MAIAFARIKYVKRSTGQNMCMKSAYISGARIHFEGSKYAPPKTYNYPDRGEPISKGILLPDGASEKLRNSEYLWNLAESAEGRARSVVGKNLTGALPDDLCITDQDRIEIAKEFVQQEFVSLGFVAEYTIHPAEIIEDRNEEGDLISTRKNCYFHALITERRLDSSGERFESNKPRNLFVEMRNGRVIDAIPLDKKYADCQNKFFEKKGYDLKVSYTGIVSQVHMDPKKLRGVGTEIIRANHERVVENRIASLDPERVVDKLLEVKSHFSEADLNRFMEKHVDPENAKDLRDSIFYDPNVVQLVDHITGKELSLFTSNKVLNEEKEIVRNAKRIHEKPPLKSTSESSCLTKTLTLEQKLAFDSITQGKEISCVECFAGKGENHLLAALRGLYQNEGYTVRELAPDSVSAFLLREKGFTNAETIHRFLYAHKSGNRDVSKGKEIWLIDEAGKIENRSLSDLMKVADEEDVKLVFYGDSSQMSSVSRSGMFKVFCQEFGSYSLESVQGQEDSEQREKLHKVATTRSHSDSSATLANSVKISTAIK